MQTVRYEWVIETVDLESEDIGDVDHRESFAVCQQMSAKYPPGEGSRHDIGLVRKKYAADDPCELLTWEYAYVWEGELDEFFDEGSRVPKRFHEEVRRYFASGD